MVLTIGLLGAHRVVSRHAQSDASTSGVNYVLLNLNSSDIPPTPPEPKDMRK